MSSESYVARPLRVGLIGDHNRAVRAHVAGPAAACGAGRLMGVDVRCEWLPTDSIPAMSESQLIAFDALWCVPNSPYANMGGALRAIRLARENNVPFLGTCGGFQHAVIEYARNVLGIEDGDHAESNPYASTLIVTPLSCSMVGREGAIRINPGSRAAQMYGCLESVERYHCNFGLNPQIAAALHEGGLRITGVDDSDPPQVRVVELPGLRFFVAMLFQPELSSTAENPHPVIRGLIEAAAVAATAAHRAVAQPVPPAAQRGRPPCASAPGPR